MRSEKEIRQKYKEFKKAGANDLYQRGVIATLEYVLNH